jgi:hypothetical protein
VANTRQIKVAARRLQGRLRVTTIPLLEVALDYVNKNTYIAISAGLRASELFYLLLRLSKSRVHYLRDTADQFYRPLRSW